MDHNRRELLFRSSTALAVITGVPLGLSARSASGEVRSRTDIHIELQAVPCQVVLRMGTAMHPLLYQVPVC